MFRLLKRGRPLLQAEKGISGMGIEGKGRGARAKSLLTKQQKAAAKAKSALTKQEKSVHTYVKESNAFLGRLNALRQERNEIIGRLAELHEVRNPPLSVTNEVRDLSIKERETRRVMNEEFRMRDDEALSREISDIGLGVSRRLSNLPKASRARVERSLAMESERTAANRRKG